MDSEKPVGTSSSVKKTNKKDFFLKHNTWTSSTMKRYAYNMKLKEINVITTTKVDIFSLSITSRIEAYEKQYNTCMNKKTELSNWIKTVQAKGPPSPLMEGYTPPPRSRLSDYFNFTKPKRKKPTTPSAKASLSTLLKKATDTLSNKQKPLLKKRLRFADASTHQPRFSLSTSLGRFSLSNNNNNTTTKRFSMPASKKYSNDNPQTISTNTTITPSFMDDETPPTSPSSIDTTIITPPHSPTSSSSNQDNTFFAPLLQGIVEEDTPLSSNTTLKKKHTTSSLLITPSFSTIRLISQKSHFLKRQSMLA